MVDDNNSPLDAVEDGPVTSGSAEGADTTSTGSADDHPTVAALLERYPAEVQRFRLEAGDQYVVWINPTRSHEILAWLKNDAGQLYDMMSDVTAVDYGKGRPIEVVYQMYSTPHGRALRIRCPLPLDALEIDSVYDLWKAVNWLEREVYDLFGITFRGHPDLRRILMQTITRKVIRSARISRCAGASREPNRLSGRSTRMSNASTSPRISVEVQTLRK